MLPFNNLFAIVAVDLAGGIGKDNQMPWHISEDLRHFKALTLNHYIIMGRKTWESLPTKPLPERKHILLTSQPIELNNVFSFASVESVLHFIIEHPEELFFVVGGESIYKQFLPYCSKLYLTRVFTMVEADTFFPPVFINFKLRELSHFNYDGKANVYFRFCLYQRTKA